MTTESNPLDRTGTPTLRLNLGGTILAVDVPRKPFIMGDCVTVSKKIYDKLIRNKQFLLLRMLETPTNKYQMTQSIVYFKDKLPSGSKCNSHVIVLYNGNIIDGLMMGLAQQNSEDPSSWCNININTYIERLVNEHIDLSTLSGKEIDFEFQDHPLDSIDSHWDTHRVNTILTYNIDTKKLLIST